MQAQACNQEELKYLLVLLDKLKAGENIIFTKFGDGEYACMSDSGGANCDGDTYHAWLGEELKKALIGLSKKPHAFIAKWWENNGNTAQYCNTLAQQHNIKVPWVCYHLIMNGDEFLSYDYMHQFAEFLITSKRKKIFIGNHMNARLKNFFRADVLIEIPAQNWSFEYTAWRNTIASHVKKDCILLIGGGLCSKVLINDLTNDYDITCIDIGSAFDLLGRKQRTRRRRHTYEDEVRYYKDLLPINWD